jgi:single-stranded-DNA-specific exonuclease
MGFELATEGARAFAVDRSFSGRSWSARPFDPRVAQRLSETARLSPVLAQILAARGTDLGALNDLLQPTLKRLLPDPFVLNDMERAVARTVAALEHEECIAIFGDYDVDGSCSAALLSLFLAAIGKPARVYIPDRLREGYGPNITALRLLKEEGAGLVITVDCGAAAHAPLSDARALGLDVVVLDHHATNEPVPALAHVNPNRGDDHAQLGHLCAAGVSFLFVIALNRQLRAQGWYALRGIAEPDLMDLTDLVALATVCDVVPLVGVNRAFVRQGLLRMTSRMRPGLAALCEAAKAHMPLGTYALGYVLGPRINAGGRVGRCDLGQCLLAASDLNEARPIAAQLDWHNRERQAIEALILEEAIALAELQHNQPFILLAEPNWHQGVVGIVAGRLKDRFLKPSFVVGLMGGEGRGSARSVPGFDIGEAIRLAASRNLIAGGGGHAMAAGFSLTAEQVEGLRTFLLEHFAAQGTGATPSTRLVLDAVVASSACRCELVEEFERIGPFGAGNLEPVVGISDLVPVYADTVGQGHIKLRLRGPGGMYLDAIAFRAAGTELGKGLLASRGKAIHVAGRLKVDEWGGRRRVQLQLDDAAPAQL